MAAAAAAAAFFARTSEIFWILLEQFGLQPLGHHKFRTENCFSNSRAKLCQLGLYSVYRLYTLQHSECTSPNTVKVTLRRVTVKDNCDCNSCALCCQPGQGPGGSNTHAVPHCGCYTAFSCWRRAGCLSVPTLQCWCILDVPTSEKQSNA